MGTQSFHKADAAKLEALLLKALEHGLTGNPASVQHLARQILKSPPASLDREDFRERVGRILVEAPSAGTHAVGRARRTVAPAPLSPPVDSESNLALFDATGVSPDLHNPVLPESVSSLIARIAEERRSPDRLLRVGLEPIKTVLLTGAPGVGKTMTAQHLAVATDLPLLRIELAAVVSSFLGRSGQNVRMAFDHARREPCLLFLDEFDALAKQRDDAADVGELKRLVNVILLELENWPPTSLLVAATNHHELLDKAIQRRFDVVIDIPLPSLEAREAITRQVLGDIQVPVADSVAKVVALATNGWSGSDITRGLREALRESVMSDVSVEISLFHHFLHNIKDGSDDVKAAFVASASKALGASNRKLAAILGTSHPTVARLLKKGQAMTEGDS